MMSDKPGKKVAIVVADGFEQVELESPRKALQDAGYTADIVSPVAGKTVQGYHHAEKGDQFPVDVALGKAKAEDYDALVLPGGVANPDTLRHDTKVLDFVRHFVTTGKPIAAICHGPWTLIDAGAVSGRKVTSWPSLKSDLLNAGAKWVDETVVVDRGLVTSRNPGDLPAFNRKMLEEIKEGPHRASQEMALMSKLGELIKDINVAMLVTQESDGTLRSRPMVTQNKKLERHLWFFTGIDSAKSEEVAEEPQVNLSYADPKSSRYVSVSGRGKVVRDRQKLEELWTPFVKAWFPKGLEDPDLGLLRVTVDQAEYWDAPAGKAVALFGLAKSLLTGRPYQGEGTQHEKLDLDAARSSAPSDGEQVVKADDKADGKSEAKAEGKSETKSDVKADDKADTKSEVKADAKNDTKADVKADVEADVKAATKVDTKADAKVDTKADDKTDAKSEVKSDTKTETKADVKSDTKSETKADAKSDAKSETKAASDKAGKNASAGKGKKHRR